MDSANAQAFTFDLLSLLRRHAANPDLQRMGSELANSYHGAGMVELAALV